MHQSMKYIFLRKMTINNETGKAALKALSKALPRCLQIHKSRKMDIEIVYQVNTGWLVVRWDLF